MESPDNDKNEKMVRSEENDREDEYLPSRRSLSLSEPTIENIEKLQNIRTMSWRDRLFRKVSTGSLRGVVLMWIRMTLGIGLLTLPFYLKQYGAFTGIIVIIICALVNLQSYYYIFEAVFYSGKKNYPDLIKSVLGNGILTVFRFTFLIDIASAIMIYSVVSWNLLEYIIYFFKIGEEHWDEWFINKDTLEFNENNGAIFLIRCVFFYSMFLLTIPLFMKKNLDALQKVTIGYLVSLFVLVLILLIEMPFFSRAYKDEDIEFHWFKPISYNWIECFFGLCIAFYVQPFIFSLRGELLLPSLKRTKKISTISVSLEATIFVVLGFIGYWSLGDLYTPNLFILRKPYPGKSQISELIFQLSICFFFLLNTLGLAMFNPGLRDYLYSFSTCKNTWFKYMAISLAPFLLICTLSFAYPYVIRITNFFGFTINNFNGYIIPILMKIQIIKAKKQSKMHLALCY